MFLRGDGLFQINRLARFKPLKKRSCHAQT